MKNLILLIILSFSVNLFSQNEGEQKKINAYDKGNFFIGVNSSLLDISANTLGLSPLIGYALSDNEMVYGSLYYTEDPRISTFKLGYNRRVYYSSYFGVSGSIYGEGSDWTKDVIIEIGVMKPIFNWLIVAPKISFTGSFNDFKDDFYFSTGVSFMVKI